MWRRPKPLLTAVTDENDLVTMMMLMKIMVMMMMMIHSDDDDDVDVEKIVQTCRAVLTLDFYTSTLDFYSPDTVVLANTHLLHSRNECLVS